MRRMKSIRHFSILTALAAALSGCGSQDMRDLQDFVKKTRNKQHSRIEPLPEFKPYETYLYQANDLRDPFSPSVSGKLDHMLTNEESSGIHPDLNRPREALEEYPLDTLRMVGTLEQGGVSWALVQAPDNTIHRVQPGNYLGQNHGKIIHIDEYQIDITEIVPDGLGGWMERSASLALSE